MRVARLRVVRRLRLPRAVRLARGAADRLGVGGDGRLLLGALRARERLGARRTRERLGAFLARNRLRAFLPPVLLGRLLSTERTRVLLGRLLSAERARVLLGRLVGAERARLLRRGPGFRLGAPLVIVPGVAFMLGHDIYLSPPLCDGPGAGLSVV